jgi:hypothetical protein
MMLACRAALRTFLTLAALLAAGRLLFPLDAFGQEFVPAGGSAPLPEPRPTPPPLPPRPSPPPIAPTPPPQTVVDACQANISEKDGVVTVDIADTSRANQDINIKVGDLIYAASFDPIGRLRLEAPIFARSADIHWLTKGQTPCDRRGIAFTHYDTTYFTALIWEGKDYDLVLHVVEPPDGRIGGLDHYVYPKRPNLDLKTGLGSLRKFGKPVAGASQVLLYTLPPQNQRGEGDIWFHVEFASRGDPARPPYCGGTALATVNFKLFHLDAGKLERRGSAFSSVPCGTSWDQDHYYQRWKWKL